MTPFILRQHEKDREQLMQLKANEIESVSGGCASPDDVIKLPTLTVTPNGDGGDDGCGEG